MSVFSLQVDTVQQRLASDGVSTLVGAQDWDLALSSGIFLDGVTGTIMLQPAAIDGASWLSSNSGIYDKLPPTAFTLTPSSADPNWTYPTQNADGAPFYKYVDNMAGAGGVSTASVSANQAMVVEMCIGQGTASTDPLGNVGWSSTGDASAGVCLKFYADLSADVYKNGVFLAHYSMSGQTVAYGQTDGQIPSQTPGQFIRLLLIPCRQRELLVISSNGGGFSHIFSDIAEGTSSPIITPNAPFWFFAEPGVDTTFRCALCQYVASGNAISKQCFWRLDPGASPLGGFQNWIDADLNGCSVTCAVADGINPSSAYANNTNGVRLNLTIAGSGTPALTPFIYAARGYTNPQVANTVGPPLDVTAFALGLDVEWADSVSGVHASLRLKDPKAIAAAGVVLSSSNRPGALVECLCDRPWQILDDDVTQLIEGINEPPTLEERIRFQTSAELSPGSPTYGDQTSANANESVRLVVRDMWLLAENFLFKEPIPLDGMTLGAAYTLVSDAIGITNSAAGRSPNISSSIATYVLPKAGNPTSSDFNVLIEPGDRGSDWLDRLHKTYAGNAFHGMTPMNGWSQPQLLATADMSSTPALSLYDSLATAIANGVSSPTYLNLFRKVDVQMLKPEANDIYVQGFDARFRRPILVHQLDSVNSDPTVIPASRTPAWRGCRISYTWIDPTLSTLGACNYVMSLLFPRLTVARSLIEFEAEFNPALARGALVELYFLSGGGIRSPVDGTFQNPAVCRIKSVSAGFVQTANDGKGLKWRPTRYIAEFGIDAANLHTGPTTLAGIAGEWSLRASSKTVQWGDANDKPTWRRPLILQAEA